MAAVFKATDVTSRILSLRIYPAGGGGEPICTVLRKVWHNSALNYCHLIRVFVRLRLGRRKLPEPILDLFALLVSRRRVTAAFLDSE